MTPPPQQHSTPSPAALARPASVAPNFMGTVGSSMASYQNYYPMHAAAASQHNIAPPSKSSSRSSGGASASATSTGGSSSKSSSKSSSRHSTSAHASSASSQSLIPPSPASSTLTPTFSHLHGQYGHYQQSALAAAQYFAGMGSTAFLQQTQAMSMMHGHGAPGSGAGNPAGQYQDPRTGHGQAASMYSYSPYSAHPSLMPQLNPTMRR